MCSGSSLQQRSVPDGFGCIQAHQTLSDGGGEPTACGAETSTPAMEKLRVHETGNVNNLFLYPLHKRNLRNFLDDHMFLHSWIFNSVLDRHPCNDLFLMGFGLYTGASNSSKGGSEPTTCGEKASTAGKENCGCTKSVVSKLSSVVSVVVLYA